MEDCATHKAFAMTAEYVQVQSICLIKSLLALFPTAANNGGQGIRTGQAKHSSSFGYAPSLQQFLAQGLPELELVSSVLHLKLMFLP